MSPRADFEYPREKRIAEQEKIGQQKEFDISHSSFRMKSNGHVRLLFSVFFMFGDYSSFGLNTYHFLFLQLDESDFQ